MHSNDTLDYSVEIIGKNNCQEHWDLNFGETTCLKHVMFLLSYHRRIKDSYTKTDRYLFFPIDIVSKFKQFTTESVS